MKVVITDYEYDNIDNEKKIIAEAGFDLYAYQCNSEDELIEKCRDADGVIVQYCEITARVIDAMEHCRIIIKYGIGVNNIDSAAATRKGIYVCNVPDYGVDEVSNHAITMIMMLSKKMIRITNSLRAGTWGYQCVEPLYRFRNKTLGLVGFGRIPRMVAEKMKNFGLEIVAYDPYVPEKAAQDLGVKLVDFDTLVKMSDYISVHCPLTDDTTHLFNRGVFQKMKNTACIVNTARGPIVDQEDLIEALKNGEIAGAGLDVYEKEPITKDNPLLQMDNVICTPHCAWYSEDAIVAVQSGAAKEVVNVLQGNMPWHAVNMTALKNQN
ncbi:MAG: C-terminal binding protein [Eubacteriales bacterium]|jgi:D-3-phosphoglycerate dehydrogenase